ncbi:unnamed protein product [Rotaria magnacalcarata]|uniref:Hermes trasposase DNA-binding domain-containing protein n=1 Tax=Rotaria magnacalcarata TaxID=392030 RepID=A0A820GFF1_9BILA|nr:unnamed protein product [Rotaria magnacalcarata]CAF4274777.1 unnamed protein product [Rotaria magnacalcarata]
MPAHSRSCESKAKKGGSSGQQLQIHHYYNATPKDEKKSVKTGKNSITSCGVEFVVQDGRAFNLLQSSGFFRLAKQTFDIGRRISSSTNIDIEGLLPTPTTVTKSMQING